MPILGRLHPVLVHFPIALVLVAAIAEAAATATGARHWRTVAVANVRAGAVFAIAAAVAGWFFALDPGMEPAPLLEWHRWLGTIAAGATFGAALASSGAERRSSFEFWIYRITLIWAAMLVAVTGHFGGLLVWGVNFLHR